MGKRSKKVQDSSDIELVPDAWPRFERFIRDIAKAGPQHRKAKPKSKLGKSLASLAAKKIDK
jgi:hypothetical protein